MNWLSKIFNRKTKEVEEVVPPYEMTTLDKQVTTFIQTMLENIKDVEKVHTAWEILYSYCDISIETTYKLGARLGFKNLKVLGLMEGSFDSYFVKVPLEVYTSLFDACREEVDRQKQLDRVEFGLRLESICEIGCEETKKLIENVK